MLSPNSFTYALLFVHRPSGKQAWHRSQSVRDDFIGGAIGVQWTVILRGRILFKGAPRHPQNSVAALDFARVETSPK